MMALDLKCGLVMATVGLACAVGLDNAHAANLAATETVDTAALTGSQFDVTAFTSTSTGESADGSGAFFANATATGMALVVLTEGVGGPNSDWFELVYSGAGAIESVTAHWRSDLDPGLPP
jgi:hypothetical protein